MARHRQLKLLCAIFGRLSGTPTSAYTWKFRPTQIHSLMLTHLHLWQRSQCPPYFAVSQCALQRAPYHVLGLQTERRCLRPRPGMSHSYRVQLEEHFQQPMLLLLLLLSTSTRTTTATKTKKTKIMKKLVEEEKS